MAYRYFVSGILSANLNYYIPFNYEFVLSEPITTMKQIREIEKRLSYSGRTFVLTNFILLSTE